MALKDHHGLIQKAFTDAASLPEREQIRNGEVWKRSLLGWTKTGILALPRDREDFLLAQLDQLDR